MLDSQGKQKASVNCRGRETRRQSTTASSRRLTLSGKNLWCGPETAACNRITASATLSAFGYAGSDRMRTQPFCVSEQDAQPWWILRVSHVSAAALSVWFSSNNATSRFTSSSALNVQTPRSSRISLTASSVTIASPAGIGLNPYRSRGRPVAAPPLASNAPRRSSETNCPKGFRSCAASASRRSGRRRRIPRVVRMALPQPGCGDVPAGRTTDLAGRWRRSRLLRLMLSPSPGIERRRAGRRAVAHERADAYGGPAVRTLSRGQEVANA